MKNSFLTITLLSFAISLTLNLRQRQINADQKAELAEQEARITELQAKLGKSEADLAREQKSEAQAASGGEQAIAELRARAERQSQIAEAARQKFMDAQANAREAADTDGLSEGLRQEKVIIGGLEARLRVLKQQLAQLNARGKVDLETEKWQQNQSLADLDTQIREQQAQVQLAQKKVNELKGVRDFQSRIDLEAAQKSLKEQKTALQLLKDQKASENAAWNSQRSLTRQGGEAARAELTGAEHALEQRIEVEKTRYAGLQKEEARALQSRKSRQDELKRLELEAKSEQDKASELSDALKQAEEKLKAPRDPKNQ